MNYIFFLDYLLAEEILTKYQILEILVEAVAEDKSIGEVLLNYISEDDLEHLENDFLYE